MGGVIGWLTDPANWTGSEGIWVRVLEHFSYSIVALAIAAGIGIPAGLYVGHTGRGRFVAVNLAGVLRAVPSLGLLYVSLIVLGDAFSGELGVWVPTQVVLVVLAIPPILAGAYAGVEQVDPGAKDAAIGMGMTGREVLFEVELPCALPLLASGLRSSALQVIATATLAATLGMGGLGRFLLDGLAVRDYSQMAGGAILVAALALSVDALAAGLQRVFVSPGLSGKGAKDPKKPSVKPSSAASAP